MASDEPSGARPGPVVLRIKLRYDDVEAMILRFAPNVGKTGLFLPTKSLQPLGAEIKFELRLSTDQPVLVGLGRVKAVRAPDPDNPKATFGMAVELMRVTRESRDLILRMLERRKLMGLAETAIPMPADIDEARRSDFVDTGIKDHASGAIPQLVSAVDSNRTSSEPLMTAPRRQTGPLAVAKVAVDEPLPPEQPRRRRVPIADLIASASGPITMAATTSPVGDPLDDNVDVAAVLARARALAGSDLDGELAALLDSAAAPIAIDIEAASAELARQLGGAAVRRDRSARWAPPPRTANDGAAITDAATSTAHDREANGRHANAIDASTDAARPAPASDDIVAPAATENAAARHAPASDSIVAPAATEIDAARHAPASDSIVAPAATEIRAGADAARHAPMSHDIVAPDPAATEIDAARHAPMSHDIVAPAATEIDAARQAPTSHVIVAPDPAATEIDARGEDEHAPDRAELSDGVHDEIPTDVLASVRDGIDGPAAAERAAAERAARDAAERVFLRGEILDDDDHATPIATVEPEVPTQDDDAPLFIPARRDSFAPKHASFESERSTGLIHDGADASHFEDESGHEVAHEVEPEQIHDEIHRLEDGDFEEVEHTQVGEPIVDPVTFDQHAYATVPGEQAALADRLDQQLDEAESEDLGFQETIDAGLVNSGLDPGQSSGGFSLEEPPGSGDYFVPLGHGGPAAAEPYGHHELEAALAAAVAEEEEIEEIDDFEILAEADADDADLLALGAEQELSHRHAVLDVEPARPSFLSRLALDDDSDLHAPAAGQFDDFAHEPGQLDPRVLSAGHALRAFDDSDGHGDFNRRGAFTPEPSDSFASPIGEQSYTFASELSDDEFDAPHGDYAAPPHSGGFVPPDAFDQSDVIAIAPVSRFEQRQADEDFPDLESALEALDVDLDDLGGRPPTGAGDDVPTVRGEGVRQTGGGRVVAPAPIPKSGRVPKRATTDDGIVIDFDDDDR